eukprot:5848071-Prymnesium_polylepis.1
MRSATDARRLGAEQRRPLNPPRGRGTETSQVCVNVWRGNYFPLINTGCSQGRGPLQCVEHGGWAEEPLKPCIVYPPRGHSRKTLVSAQCTASQAPRDDT